MIPRLKPALGWRELFALALPARRAEVQAFEQAFAALMGQRHAVACPYGRTGLWLLLQALGLQGKEIICPAYTCVVVPHAIVHSGNEPVFVDSQEPDFNMNLDLVRDAINEKTGAIIATSIFGYPVDLDKLGRLRREFPHVQIIQDCAHGFAAEWQGQPVQRAGAAAIFGLNISKLITSIFGGMVTTDDEALSQRLRGLRGQLCRRAGWLKNIRRRIYWACANVAFWGPVYDFVNWLERQGHLNRFVKYYDDAVIDMPRDYLHEMGTFAARIGRIQTGRYHDIIAQRRDVAALYQERLGHRRDLVLPPGVPGATYSHYVVRTARRDEIVRLALGQGIQLGTIIDYCIPEMAAYRPRGGNRFPCPVASEFARRVVNLPLSVSRPGAERVCMVLENTLDGLVGADGFRAGSARAA